MINADMKKCLVFFYCIVLISSLALGQEIDYKGLPEWSWHKEDSTEYYLYTPIGISQDKKYPIALAMHGCCGEDYHATLRNAVDPVVRMWHNFGADTQTVPTYIIAPKTSQGWKQHFVSLKKVIDDLVAFHNGDPQRIYVCGFSMGGEGTFSIIQQYPDFFAAAITMGMSFKGDSSKVKDIPIWANQGETDWWSRFLRKQIAAIRALNGYGSDTGSTWVTGVNPMYSNFKGIDHGVQWAAASTQDLTGWAYSKINDGNKCPVVFFIKPEYKKIVNESKSTDIEIDAKDADGSISKIDVYLNKKLIRTLVKSPYKLIVSPVSGDNIVEAVAFDNKGKPSTATTVIKVNMLPKVLTKQLPAGNAGSYYKSNIVAKGNGRILFSLVEKKLPGGLRLYPDGTIKGVPLMSGLFPFTVKATDEDNESILQSYTVLIKAKNSNEVMVTDAVTKDGTAYLISKMMIGETPNFNSRDSILTTDLEEINFNGIDKYKGLTYIKTDINDANKTGDNFLSFNIADDAIIYVAYEKLDILFHSTIPGWLKDFKKEDGEITAQYRYFDVYSKLFPKGKVTLPAADAKNNLVGSNYFVMIKKRK